MAASLLFAAWTHLSLVSCARVLRFALKPGPEPASVTLLTLGFALIHGYSAWLLVYHAAVLLWNGLTPDPKTDPIRIEGPMQSSFQDLFGTPASALAHDACCSFQRTELRGRGSPIDEALRAQARAAGMFLRRVWSAVAESRRALAQLKPEDPPQNLYRLPPAPEFADGPIDVHEIARVVGLSAERFEEHFEALAGRPSDPADEDAAPDLAAETLAEYEERFTRRILYHSVIEYRLHAFALGVDVDRRAFSHD